MTATINGTALSVTYDVVEPSGVVIEQEQGTNVYHVNGTPSVGFKGRAYITPSSVSFYNIEAQEGLVNAVAIEYFAYQNGESHPTGDWLPIGEVVVGKGSKDESVDTIQGGSDNHTPYTNGTFTWAIPWSFRVEGSVAAKQFPTPVNHVKTIDSAGRMTISKGGTTKSAALNDPTSGY